MTTMIDLTRRGELRRALAYLLVGWLERRRVTITVWQAGRPPVEYLEGPR